ncbi:DUF6732 family protein [Pseudoroseicyclus tamaricis]|uniref:Uncharacterized protein n=1 Tax=Pseudoroseicyclus tamaricis TaxID=2705421 RepID=A0A6B2JEU7_9RHOB|nr:DUF6732 family protein [Pseudoroseicyclus tamaricis]NDU99442.1 hypothetical protein [Pseudoroseicyclus tamaricis]
MRPTIAIATLPPLLAPSLGLAHVGHIGELAGHDHWVAGAAIGAAVAAAVWGALKGRKDEGGKDAAEAEAEGDEVEA